MLGLPQDLLSPPGKNKRRVKVELDEGLGRKLASTVDVLGQMNMAEYTPLVAEKPLPGLTFLRDRMIPATGGNFSVVNGEIRMDGTGQKHELYTRDYGLYMPGLLGLAGLRARMATPNTGVYEFGYGSDTGDRVGVRDENGSWSTFVQAGSTRWYSQPRANWLDSLDGTGPSGLTVPDLNGLTFRAILGWYGGLSILFSFVVPDRLNGDRLVIFDSSGPRADGVTLHQPDLPIFAEADGGVMYVGGRQYGVYGRIDKKWRVSSNRRVTKATVSTKITPLVTFRHKQALRWEAVPVMLGRETVTSTVDAEYVIILGGTLTKSGGSVPSGEWTALNGIDPEETALEQNITADTITGGYRAPGDLVLAGQGNRPGAGRGESSAFSIPSGVTVTLGIQNNSGAGSASGILRAKELF